MGSAITINSFGFNCRTRETEHNTNTTKQREKETYPAVERPALSRQPAHCLPHPPEHAAEQCHRGIATKACSRPSGRTAGRRRGNLPSSASGAGAAKCQSRCHGYRRRRLGSVVRGCCTLSYLFSSDAQASPGGSDCGSPAGACWVACLSDGVGSSWRLFTLAGGLGGLQVAGVSRCGRPQVQGLAGRSVGWQLSLGGKLLR